MRLAVVVTVLAAALAGCWKPPPLQPVVPARHAEQPGDVAVRGPIALGDATIASKSHAFFDAWDRAEVATVTASLGPAFVSFEDQRYLDRAIVEKALAARATRHAPIHTRTWSDERVFGTPNSAVFIGHAVETLPAEGDHPVGQRDGYETLVWVRDGAHWQVALREWTRAGLEAERARWNDYFKNGHGFSVQPNQLLVATVKGKKPGTALDLGMGQGRNAVFLATQGWKVTGVDISDEGIRIARDHAATLGVKLDTIVADVDTYDLGRDKWDLVTMIYAGDDAALVKRIIPSLKQGGLFVLEYFHADSDAAKTGAGGWKTGALAALFHDGFDIVKDQVVDDHADWAGQRVTKLVRFVAKKR